MEEIARTVNQQSWQEAVQSVQNLLKQIDGNTLNQLAWFQVYGVVDPVQVLQGIIYTGNTECLRICGTHEFADDVIEHLKLPRMEGKTSPQKCNHRILIDLLTHQVKEGSIQNPTRTVKSEKNETKIDALQVRKVLLSSMSAGEAEHRLRPVFVKGGEAAMTRAVLDCCATNRVYNRIYGQVCVRLAQNNAWKTAFTRLFGDFYRSCEHLDTDRLRTCGAFFAHLLETDVVEWKAIEAVQLDETSTVEGRIFFLAVIEELKVALGSAEVETKVEGMQGVLGTELAPEFWRLAGYDEFAHKLERAKRPE